MRSFTRAWEIYEASHIQNIKKNDSPSLSSYQPSLALLQWVRCGKRVPPIYAGMLARLSLCRSCTSSYSCCELIHAPNHIMSRSLHFTVELPIPPPPLQCSPTTRHIKINKPEYSSWEVVDYSHVCVCKSVLCESLLPVSAIHTFRPWIWFPDWCQVSQVLHDVSGR